MKRRRGIEIYFVLYLAALMLLLSDSPKRETELATTALRSLVGSTFRLLAEKQTLLCRAIVEHDSVRIVQFDSINTIVPTGLIDSIHYRIVAEDQSSGTTLSLPIAGTANAGAIAIETEQYGQALRIRWRLIRTERQPFLYRVRIEAHAKPQLPPTLERDQRAQLETLLDSDDFPLQSETTFLVGYLPDFPTTQPPSTDQPPLDSALAVQLRSLFAQRAQETTPAAAFSLVPEFTTIRTVPFVQWENRIAIYGAAPDRDLAQPPRLSGLSAALVTIEGNAIVVRSTSTQAGTTNVRITLVRRDGAEADAVFSVVTHSVQQPVIPALLYPGIEYRFDPNLSNLSGIETRALLRDDDNLTRVSSSGEPFVFTPTFRDTGRTFYFERYVGRDRIGQVIPIPCEMFPPPEITSVRRESDRQFLVVCRAYGLDSDQRSRVRLELDPPGKGTVQELYGDYSYDPKANVRLQQFRVTVSGTTGLKLYAVNGYQQRSVARDLSAR